MTQASMAMPYHGIGIINDPIHGYIRFTKPMPGESDSTEVDLIDHPWVQRMRFIAQLQSARWVYPAGEHTRFQHLLGTMSVASKIARHLLPSLRSVASDCPSDALVESLLRVSALLHDIGHGPFSHFFDENHLNRFSISHEAVSAFVIQKELRSIIEGLRRTPSARFEPGEYLHADWVAYLAQKSKASMAVPSWVRRLAPILGGIYTADNMDYVLRDSFMCGVRIGPVDIHRLIYYTFYTDRGLTLHRSGMQALFMFLSARIFLYQNVYYHRTARALDLQMREIFPETISILLPGYPLEDLNRYRDLTDWSLFANTRSWQTSNDPGRRRIADAWRAILERRIRWKPVYEVTLPLASAQHLAQVDLDEQAFTALIRDHLPVDLRSTHLRVDLAAKDARPLNPIHMGHSQLFTYDPASRRIDSEPLTELLKWLPVRIVQVYVFAESLEPAAAVASAVQEVLTDLGVPMILS